MLDFSPNFNTGIQKKNLPIEEKIKIIKNAIETEKNLELVYLKSTDVKSKRVVKPIYIGEIEYGSRTFLGLKAFCMLRNEERNFNVEKIIELKLID